MAIFNYKLTKLILNTFYLKAEIIKVSSVEFMGNFKSLFF